MNLRTTVLLLLLLSSPTATHANKVSYSGYGYDLDNRSLVFIETYTEFYDEDRTLQLSKVNYYNDRNQVVAEKTLHYDSQKYAPSFQYHNLVTGYKESLSWLQPNTALLTSSRKDGTTQKKMLNLPNNPGSPPYVADAGFDLYIRANLKRLENGEKLSFRFLNPSRLDWFVLQAEEVSQKPGAIILSIKPKNRLLRWLVSPILLTYSLNQENNPDRLLEYSGLTNLSLSKRDYIRANIIYKYSDQPEASVNMF